MTRNKWHCISSSRRCVVFLFVPCFFIVLMASWLTLDDIHMNIEDTQNLWMVSNRCLSEILQTYEHYTAQDTHKNYSTFHTFDPPVRINPHLKHINCKALFNGDQSELNKAHKYMETHDAGHQTDGDIIVQTANCTHFIKSRGYIMEPLSKEERDFPIAFSILMYKGSHQFERLLRSIYTPQNYYCIHLDIKAPDVVHKAVHSIAQCFPNVFMASKLDSVFWGHISIMYAEMNCLRDLLQYNWKYFINLSGQMFPLHTNEELVKILSLYNGANDVEGTLKRAAKFTIRHRWSWRLAEQFDVRYPVSLFKDTPPYNLTIYKGSNQVVLSRQFVLYFMYSKVSKDLIKWSADIYAPDENIWPTLNHNTHIHAPGGYQGDPEAKIYTARASLWKPSALQVNWSWKHWECQGKWVNAICILGVGDLAWLYHRPELFVNKFHENYEWLAYDCMEELIFNRTISRDQEHFNSTYYDNLDIVKHKELIVSSNEAVLFSSLFEP